MEIRVPSFVRPQRSPPGTVRCLSALHLVFPRHSTASREGRLLCCLAAMLVAALLAVTLTSCGPSRRDRRSPAESGPTSGADQRSGVATVPDLSNDPGKAQPTGAVTLRTPRLPDSARATSGAQQTRHPETSTVSVDAPSTSGGAASSDSGETIIGRLVIPSIDVDVPIAHVSWHLAQVDGETVGQWDSLPGVAGHHVGTAPLGGDGNCVISGHSRAEDGAVLARLEELEPGDEIVLVPLGGLEHRYKVKQVHRLAELGASLSQRREHAAYMDGTEDARLTLITCWPDWAYTHRLVVVAVRS